MAMGIVIESFSYLIVSSDFVSFGFLLHPIKMVSDNIISSCFKLFFVKRYKYDYCKYGIYDGCPFTKVENI